MMTTAAIPEPRSTKGRSGSAPKRTNAPMSKEPRLRKQVKTTAALAPCLSMKTADIRGIEPGRPQTAVTSGTACNGVTTRMSDEVPATTRLNVQRTRRAGPLPGQLGQDRAEQSPLLLRDKRGSTQHPGPAEVRSGQKSSDQHENGDWDQENDTRIDSRGSG